MLFSIVINININISKYDTSHVLLWMISKSWQCAFKAESLLGKGCWNRGGRWGTQPSHFFCRSVNSISTKGVDYAPNNITCPPQIFRPSYIPVCSLMGKHFDPVNCNLHVWQNGLGWLQAICTCPQKAIVGLQKFLHRWIPCKKSL